MMRIAALTGATVMGGLLLATLPVSIRWSAEKELLDISGQGLCGGWKARNPRKRSRRSPEALTAGGPTLRGWHDLLNVRPKRGELTSGMNFRRHRPSQQIAASIAR
jgi:hypothetical protein